MLRGLVNLFWFAFMVDGALSVLDETMASHWKWLWLMRQVTACAVALASVGMVGIVILTPRVPKRVLIPLIAFVLGGGEILLFFLKPPHPDFWLSIGQVGLGAAVWWWSRSKNAKWVVPFEVGQGIFFRWQHTLIAASAAGVSFLVMVVLGFAVFSREVETYTGGYVRLRLDGLYLAERHFQSRDREVHLVGMMHIAQGEFYVCMLPQADSFLPSVVLVEGITDTKRLLGKRRLNYSKLAKLLNITSQEQSEYTRQVRKGLEEGGNKIEGFDFRPADVDVAAFHPQTISYILAVAEIFESKNSQEMILAITNHSSLLRDKAVQQHLWDDILVMRNEQLTTQIKDSLRDYQRVIVPWGAIHLSEIESWLYDQNFVQSAEIERKALSFW